MFAEYRCHTSLMSNDQPESGVGHHSGQARHQDQARDHSPTTPSAASTLPHPSLGLPAPRLAFEFRMAAKLRGDVCRVRLRNEGVRDLNVAEGGEWVADFGRGTVRVS